MSSGFIQFLTQESILNVALATMIGFYLNDFTNGISQIIITPIINGFLKDDHIDNIDTFYIEIFSVKFMLGKLLVLLLRLIITFFIIYCLYVILNKLTKEKKIFTIPDIINDI